MRKQEQLSFVSLLVEIACVNLRQHKGAVHQALIMQLLQEQIQMYCSFTLHRCYQSQVPAPEVTQHTSWRLTHMQVVLELTTTDFVAAEPGSRAAWLSSA